MNVSVIIGYLLIDSSPVDNTFTDGLGNWISTDFVQRTGPGPFNNVGPKEGVIGSGMYGKSSHLETILTSEKRLFLQALV